ncbi:LAFE_0F12288g1_1 [Lachancea fermentati]|uniref:LAFE_0F12288g1_1 n=1 Tax=Lachancea fermentati TaxID=4955 RepID=A0A1G4MG21_LACFM|nr:LAFE_0F12288g1_1 [Lachancea fermentati]
MSFSEEQFISKLNLLDETQESIVSASKWLLSQYKEANQVATCWKTFILKSNTNTRRKLLAIYLANDVIQQSKHKRIGQFGDAFGNILGEVMGRVYPELPQDLRKKVRRVADIWKQRQVLPESALKSILANMNESAIKPSKTNISPELTPMVDIYNELSRSQTHVSSTKVKFDKSMEALDPSSVVYAENYKTVTKIGMIAINALKKSEELRKKAIDELKMMVDFQTEQLNQDQDMINEIQALVASKDPLTQQTTTLIESNALPTYEPSDGSDSESDSENESRDNEKKLAKKRSSTVAEGEDETKRTKLASFVDGEDNHEETAPEAYEPSPAEVAANSPLAVTSSIQDLLSKLAN